MSDATTSAVRRARAPHTHPDHGTNLDTPTRDSVARTLEHESHAFEPWAKVLLAALLPALGAIYAPDAFKLPLFLLTGILFIVGVLMLGKQESARNARRRD